MAKRAAQKELPGLENREITDLEKKALEYVEVRDQRMDLTKREVELQADLLTLMKTYKKREYKRDGIEIRIVVEKEKVKVKKAKEPEEK
jgi:hypothetical protein